MHSRNKTSHTPPSVQKLTDYTKVYNNAISTPTFVSTVENFAVNKIKSENEKFRKRSDDEIYIREILNSVGNTGSAVGLKTSCIINAGVAFSEIMEINNHTSKLQNGYIYKDVYDSLKNNEIANGKTTKDAEKIAKDYAFNVIFDRL